MSVMRNTLNAARYDWLGARIGGPGASMRGQWPVLIVAAVVVFGCFFAIGRLFAGGPGPGKGSSAARVSRAVIPGQLQGGPPIAAVPSSIAAPPPRRRARPARRFESQRVTTPGQAFAGETTSTEPSSATQPESVPAAPPPEPSRASSGTGPPAGGPSAGKPSAGRAGGGAASGGGGSFDSSE
jgi:uncharacterized membrane protein YgcG